MPLWAYQCLRPSDFLLDLAVHSIRWLKGPDGILLCLRYICQAAVDCGPLGVFVIAVYGLAVLQLAFTVPC